MGIAEALLSCVQWILRMMDPGSDDGLGADNWLDSMRGDREWLQRLLNLIQATLQDARLQIGSGSMTLQLKELEGLAADLEDLLDDFEYEELRLRVEGGGGNSGADYSLLEQPNQVPNPLFDPAGIMCGQFEIPFWKFFVATLIGKALIKAHIQTIFIISLCNNQLLELVENELIWILAHIPGFSSVLPDLISKLHIVRERYLSPRSPVLPNTKEKRWNLSFNLIWNSVVWLMLLNFFAKIVTSTAQRHLRKQQEKKLAQLSASQSSNGATGHVSAGM